MVLGPRRLLLLSLLTVACDRNAPSPAAESPEGPPPPAEKTEPEPLPAAEAKQPPAQKEVALAPPSAADKPVEKPAPPPPPKCDAAATPEMLKAAGAFWRENDATIKTLDAVLEKLPDDPAKRSAHARALLPTEQMERDVADDATVWCEAGYEGVFDEEPYELASPDDGPISKNGCMRREAVLKMLPFLNACDLEASKPSLEFLMAAHEPRHELPVAIIDHAARMDKAVLVLDQAAEHGPKSLQKLAIDRLADADTEDAYAALRRAASRGLCEVAMHAVTKLEEVDEDPQLPDMDADPHPKAGFHWMCMYATTKESDMVRAGWQSYLDGKGFRMRVDCKHWDDDGDPDMHGYCDPRSYRQRNPPDHTWGPSAECKESGGTVQCHSDPLNENSGVASRTEPTTFTFKKRGGQWALVDVLVRPVVTDRWNPSDAFRPLP